MRTNMEILEIYGRLTLETMGSVGSYVSHYRCLLYDNKHSMFYRLSGSGSTEEEAMENLRSSLHTIMVDIVCTIDGEFGT